MTVPDTAPGSRPVRRVLLALGTLTMVLAVAVIVLAVQLRGYGRTDDARAAALAAARQSALNLTSIDTRDFDADVKRVAESATGAFLSDFQQRVQDKGFRDALTQSQVISEGRIVDAGLVRSDSRNATVLVVIDTTVRNTATPEGRVNPYRMQLELELRDGRWLTSDLQFVA